MSPQPASLSASPERRRVVILSPGGRVVDAVLARLARSGAPADALLLYDRGVIGEWRRAGGSIRGIPLLPARWLGRQIRRGITKPPAGARTIVHTGALNGPRMLRDLARLGPDVIVLAHCGLVSADVLRAAKEGVVAVHPGLLPWIRGSSPLAHSLARGIPLGCTAFRADEGIDTGSILSRRLVPVDGSEGAGGLRDALFALWVEMTADLVANASAAPLPGGSAQPGRFPLCRPLPASESTAMVEDAVRRDRARTLFDAWRPLCGADLRLPEDADISLPEGTT